MLTPSNETVFDTLLQAFSSYPTVVEAMQTYKASIIENPEPLIKGISEIQPLTPVLEGALTSLRQLRINL